MKIKTAEATGLQLDWGLAKVIGAKRIIVNWRGVWVEDEGFKVGDDCRGWVCHTDPAVCMGLIKEHRFPIFAYTQVGGDGCLWQVNYCDADVNAESWESLEQAVARCVIAMKLGDEFECPSELWVQS